MKPPLIFNRMNSDFDIQHSVIGPNGVITGTPTYSAVKFGNGAKLETYLKYVSFTQTIGLNKGYLSAWLKMNGNYSTGGAHLLAAGNVSPTVDMVYVAYFDNIDTWRFGLWTGSGSTHVYVAVVSASHAAIQFNDGDLMHIGATWDLSQSLYDRMRLYINGVSYADSYVNFGISEATWDLLRAASMSSIRIGSWAGTTSASWQMTGYMENLKIGDVYKTDFLQDMNSERSGLNDQMVNY